MKRYISFILFAILLVACSSPAVTSTPIPPTLTATLLPPTETSIPTATSTPTQTPDPNMPPDATGKDSQGNYIKVENEVTYTWMQFPLGSETYKGWFQSRMKNRPINLTGGGDSRFNDFTLGFTLYYVSNFEYPNDVGYLVHPLGRSDYVTKGKANASLASQILIDMFFRTKGLTMYTYPSAYNGLKTAADIQHAMDDGNAMVQNLNNGGTIDVNGLLWEVRKGFDEFWINAADAKDDPNMNLANGLYMKVIVVNGKLIAILAPAGEDMMIESEIPKSNVSASSSSINRSRPFAKRYELVGL